jgi:FtsP/CotA-like multicopper oxidase with cupredoxin domain
MNSRAHRLAAAASAVSLLFAVGGCGKNKNDTTTQPTPTPVATTIEATPSASSSPGASAEPSSSASSSASPDAAAGQTITINLVNGKPSEKLAPVVEVTKGDTLTLVITSDKDYEVHVHGVDLPIEVKAGQTVTKTFPVNIATGSYEVEVEQTSFLLFHLLVK